MQVETLRELFVKELSDIYSAEKQIIKALPKMAKAASFPQLQEAFQHHLDETKRQVDRLDRVFSSIGEKPKRMKCKGMEGLIEEGEELLKEKGEPEARDAGLIAAAQRVEHYEIAAYGTVRTYAETLGESEAARLLQQTLDEEGETDKKLTTIAVSAVNPSATPEQQERRGRVSRGGSKRAGARTRKPTSRRSSGGRARTSRRTQSRRRART